MNESRATLGILYLQKVEGALETKRGAILASATFFSCTHCREFSAVSLRVSPSTHSLTGSIQTGSLPSFCLVMRTSGSLILRFRVPHVVVRWRCFFEQFFEFFQGNFESVLQFLIAEFEIQTGSFGLTSLNFFNE